jgi:hypothetical protein
MRLVTWLQLRTLACTNGGQPIVHVADGNELKTFDG